MRKKNYVRTEGSVVKARRRKALIAAAVLLGAYFFVTFIFGEMGIVKYYRMKSQHDSIVREIEKLKLDNVRLVKEVRSLRTDPSYLEKVARDKLGLARKGELVYYYDETNSKSEELNSE